MRLQLLDHRDALRERVVGEQLALGTPVARGERGVGRHLAGEQAVRERPVRQHPDAVLGAPRELRRLDLAAHQVVAHLEAVELRDRAGAGEVVDVVVRHADRPDLAGPLELEHRSHRLLGRDPLDGPVHLVEVDLVDPERLEVAVDGRADVVAARLAPDAERRLGGPGDTALGRDDHVVAPFREHLADDALGAVLSVDVGGVDPVDPRVERRVAGGDRVIVLGPAPPSAEHPGAKADHRQLEVGAAQSAPLHYFGVIATSRPPSSS